MIYAGIDIGTTSIKLSVFNDDTFLEKYSEDYDSIRNNKVQVINIEGLTNSLFNVIKAAYLHYNELEAIGITSFGEAFVMLNDKDEILYDVMLYSDLRGTEESKHLQSLIDEKELANITGQIANPMFSLPKIMYVKKNCNAIYKKTKRIMLIEDYIVYLLTGIAQIDYSLACRTLAFDINTLCWSKEILEKCEIDINLFSKPVPTGSIAGYLKESIKKKFNISKNITIINISHDQIANIVGTGVYDCNTAIDGIGTCECIAPIFTNQDKYLLAKKGFGVIPFIEKNKYVCYGLINTGCALLDWFIKEFYNKTEFINKSELFNQLNKKIDDKPGKIYVLPYFAGAGTPFMDNNAKGAIINLTLGTKRIDIYKAILESLSYEVKLNIETLKEIGITIDSLYLTGGGSRNENRAQIKANILGIPLIKCEIYDSGTIGAAIIMRYSLGKIKSYEIGFKNMIKIEKIYYPELNKRIDYLKGYEEYKRINNAFLKIKKETI